MKFCIDYDTLSKQECFWLNTVQNLVTSLSKHYGPITLDKISQKIGNTTLFEKDILNTDTALIREITLSSKTQTLIHARTIILKETYTHFTNQLDNLNNQPIGDNLLFDTEQFNREEFIIRKLPFISFMNEIESDIKYKLEHAFSRSSIFTYKNIPALKFLITEYFLEIPENTHDI